MICQAYSGYEKSVYKYVIITDMRQYLTNIFHNIVYFLLINIWYFRQNNIWFRPHVISEIVSFFESDRTVVVFRLPCVGKHPINTLTSKVIGHCVILFSIFL